MPEHFNYPKWLEQYWKTRALQVLAAPDDREDEALRRLEAPIQALSDLFTKHRPNVFKNYTHGELALAYGLFFFPQSFIRVRYPLQELLDVTGWNPTRSRPLQILDLGAGLGAAGLSASLDLRDRLEVPVKLTALDHSAEALNELNTLFSSHPKVLQGIKLETRVRDMPHLFKQKQQEPSAEYDVIMASFSINEAFRAQSAESLHLFTKSLKKLLSPNGLLLIIEPALQETAVPLQSLVDDLVGDAAYHRWAPGTYTTRCPLVGKYWPHEVRTWQPPSTLKYLNRRLFRSIEELKFHFAALGNVPPPTLETQNVEMCRLCTPIAEIKGRLLFSGITYSGALHHYDIPTRSVQKSTLQKLLKIERGEHLILKNLVSLGGDSQFRVPTPLDLIHSYSTESLNIY